MQFYARIIFDGSSITLCFTLRGQYGNYYAPAVPVKCIQKASQYAGKREYHALRVFQREMRVAADRATAGREDLLACAVAF